MSAEESAAIVAGIDVAQQAQAEIWGDDGFGVHAESRSGSIAQLDRATEELVQDRLWEVIPGLEAHFGCAVSHVSGATALIYRVGDHFAAHSDGGGDDEAPVEVRRRCISLVVALNDAATEFDGGQLEFYDATAPQIATRSPPALSVRSEPGLLVAFASSMVHRVVPVSSGRRYSLALWALEPEP